MRIVAVGGFGSGSGKTLLLERILGAAPGIGAVKTSPRSPDRLPPGGFAWEVSLEILAADGSDTRRYLDAGAAAVGWLRSVVPPPAPAGAMVRDWGRPLAGIAVEGISVAAVLRPDRRVLVAASDFSEIKPAAAAILHDVDLIVVNRRAGSEDADRALRRIERSAGGRPVVLADLGRPDDPGTAAAVAAITAWLRC